MGGLTCPGFGALEGNYLFREIAERRAAYETGHPALDIVSLGIGDVTLPICESATRALAAASREMGTPEGFRGYPPAFGYDFLREAIATTYRERGAELTPEEIYVSDGAKTDAATLPRLFGDVTAVLPDPTYPVYREAHQLAGHRIRLMAATEENGFLPRPDTLPQTPHVVYLTSPGNPIGVAYDRAGLCEWVSYARTSGSLLVFDAAYAAYQAPDALHSIYEIPGSSACAVELGSFSKCAGFTGVRCAWSVFPEEVRFGGIPLSPLWRRIKSMTSNGVSYLAQRAAEATLTPEGREETARQIAYYKENAVLLTVCLRQAGWRVFGGEGSPYLWVECPAGMHSWETFDLLLSRAQILVTPGAGFGYGGEGFIRLSAFAPRDRILLAAHRLSEMKL